MQIYDIMDIAEWYPMTMDCLQSEEGNCAPADFPLADVPPALVRNPTSDMTRSNMDNEENPEKCEHEEWINLIPCHRGIANCKTTIPEEAAGAV